MKLSGWGRFRAEECRVITPRSQDEIIRLIRKEPSLIARGNGRSYGDTAINRNATMIMTALNRFIAFDDVTGLITLEAGVLLEDLLAVCVPTGWFPPITPGTKFITIGGAMACDVHGKNHHKDGSFRNCVMAFTLLDGNGERHHCSREQNRDLFEITLGGMGLSGIILDATLQLRPIESAYIVQKTDRCRNLPALFDMMQHRADEPYTVAWIDCAARGHALGRGVVFSGRHASLDDLPSASRANALSIKPRVTRSFPFEVPIDIVRYPFLKAFNALYYAVNSTDERLVDYDTYFYPLDAIAGWNRVYGPKGFVQFQCVVPKQDGRDTITALINEIARAGAGSPLAVLKYLGKGAEGLSFPFEGYTLALDFPARKSVLELQERLNRITVSAGGRLYFAKDATASPSYALQSYQADKFLKVRKTIAGHDRFRSSLSDRIGLTS